MIEQRRWWGRRGVGGGPARAPPPGGSDHRGVSYHTTGGRRVSYGTPARGGRVDYPPISERD